MIDPVPITTITPSKNSNITTTNTINKNTTTTATVASSNTVILNTLGTKKKRDYSTLQSESEIISSTLFSSTESSHQSIDNSQNEIANKKLFVCPLSYCQKSYNYRHVRDRHVENVHGFKSNHNQSKKRLKKTSNEPVFCELHDNENLVTHQSDLLSDNLQQNQVHQDQNQHEQQQQQLIWTELLGVAV